MITVFVAAGCPHCAALLAELDRRRVRFTLVDLSAQPERLAELGRLTRERRVPVVVDHERVSIGLDGSSSALDPGGRVVPG